MIIEYLKARNEIQKAKMDMEQLLITKQMKPHEYSLKLGRAQALNIALQILDHAFNVNQTEEIINDNRNN